MLGVPAIAAAPYAPPRCSVRRSRPDCSRASDRQQAVGDLRAGWPFRAPSHTPRPSAAPSPVPARTAPGQKAASRESALARFQAMRAASDFCAELLAGQVPIETGLELVEQHIQLDPICRRSASARQRSSRPHVCIAASAVCIAASTSGSMGVRSSTPMRCAFQRAAVQERGVVRGDLDCGGAGRGIAWIDAGHCAQQRRDVRDGASNRSRRVLRWRRSG